MEKNNEINVQQEQIHDLLFKKELDWQEIIYDLINSEQLNPWDIDIIILTDKYLEKIQQFEQADFFISSKVLLAAALLLRIKSEFLLNKYIQSIDDILFGRKEEKRYSLERIELDEEIPELIPKSPMPRFRQVTLKELINSLNKAIITENRRIKKEIIDKNALREVGIAIPKRKFSIKNKIIEIYNRLFKHLGENNIKKISFTEFAGEDREERIITFIPLLHLENQKRIWMEQDGHFEEIYLWLNKTYFQDNPDPFADLKHEVEQEIENLDDEKKKRLNELNTEFDNPLREMFGELVE